MQFDIDFPQAPLTPFAPPAWCVDWNVNVSHGSDRHFRIHKLGFQLWFGDKVILPWTVVPIADHELWPRGRTTLAMRVPMTREFIRTVEEGRSRVGTLQFVVGLRLYGRLVVPVHVALSDAEGNPRPARAMMIEGDADSGSAQADCRIARDDWIAALTTLGWDNADVFEVRRPTGSGAMRLPPDEVMTHLRSAERLYAQGDYEQSVTECRRSFEALVRADAPDVTSASYERAWVRAWSDDCHAHRREILDEICRLVGKQRNKTAHGGTPRFERVDAEAILTTTLAAFRLLGHASERVH